MATVGCCCKSETTAERTQFSPKSTCILNAAKSRRIKRAECNCSDGKRATSLFSEQTHLAMTSNAQLLKSKASTCGHFKKPSNNSQHSFRPIELCRESKARTKSFGKECFASLTLTSRRF